MNTGGGYRLRAYTRSAGAVLRECSRKDVAVENLRRGKDYIEFNVFAKDYEKISDILKAFNIDFRSVSSYGGARAKGILKRRAAAIIGLILGFAVIAAASQFIFSVEIIGDSRYNGVIESILKDSGADGIMYKYSLDRKALELKIIECVPEITEATVFIEGAVLKIATVANETPSKPSGARDRIISGYKAVVTRVYVSSGTAEVQAGDTVEKGEVLIEGHINTNKEDYQEPEDGVFVPVEAKGEVFGKVYYHKRVMLSDQAVISEPTGKIEIRRDIYIGGRRIGKAHKKPFDSYSSSSSYGEIGFILPIKIETVVYRETAERSVGRGEYKEWLIAKVSEEIQASMPAGAKILSREITESGDILDVFYEAEHRIDC